MQGSYWTNSWAPINLFKCNNFGELCAARLPTILRAKWAKPLLTSPTSPLRCRYSLLATIAPRLLLFFLRGLTAVSATATNTKIRRTASTSLMHAPDLPNAAAPGPTPPTQSRSIVRSSSPPKPSLTGNLFRRRTLGSSPASTGLSYMRLIGGRLSLTRRAQARCATRHKFGISKV
jgi:hypothetical protein